MDPREFHRLAERLSRGNDPAELRATTSRAYYAVFNVGVQHLNQIVPLSRGAAAHGQVQNLLANSGDSNVAQVGSDLGDLHSRRIDADYEMASAHAENAKTVQAIVSDAKEMIDAIDRALSGPRSQTLKKTIQQYWTQILREPLRGRPLIA